jgi:hypothetical protein
VPGGGGDADLCLRVLAGRSHGYLASGACVVRTKLV